MSVLPENDLARKMLPLFRQIVRYFPKALREITKVSVVNNVRYNPDRAPADINWARGKSADQLGSSFRHMLEREVDGKVFEAVPANVAAVTGIDRVYVLAENAWRALAALELDIEAQEALEAGPEHEDGPVSEGFAPGFEQRCSPETQGQSAAERIGAQGEWKPTEGVNEASDRLYGRDLF